MFRFPAQMQLLASSIHFLITRSKMGSQLEKKLLSKKIYLSRFHVVLGINFCFVFFYICENVYLSWITLDLIALA